jgi:hypothetical protein
VTTIMRHSLRMSAMLLTGSVLLGLPRLVPAQPAATAAAAKPADARADALWEAARKGDAPTVKRLLDEGVDVNAKFRYGATALSYACDRGHLDVVRVLLERGADPNVKDTFYGATPMSWASSPAQTRKPEHATIVGLLLKAGASGQAGALFAAVGEGDAPMTQVIVAHGGLSASVLGDALESATREKQSEIIAILEKAGAKMPPVVTLSEAQLARFAGEYSDGRNSLTFAVKGGKLTGGPGGQSSTLVARSETTFAIEGRPGLSIEFAGTGERAASLTVNQGGPPTVYKRVEGK